MKILIIDDSIYERQRHKLVLRDGGVACEVLEAEDGQQGLEFLQKEACNIGLIILDWHMPVLDGVAFLQEFSKHSDWQHVKVIMSTSFGADERKQYVRQIFPNLAGYVVKPYQPEEMIQVVKRIMHSWPAKGG